MKRTKRILAAAACFLVAMILAVVFSCTPFARANRTLRKCGFASLPDSAASVMQSRRGSGFAYGLLISFQANSPEIAQFISDSPIISGPQHSNRNATPLPNGFEGAMDSVTAWQMTVETNTPIGSVELRMWDNG